MFSIQENVSFEEAGQQLLAFILHPAHWVILDRLEHEPDARPGKKAEYQRRVGPVRICASVDITESLGVFLRIAFRATGLTPLKASDHLEAFLKGWLPLTPNSEWQVQIDERRWIHFIRRYTGNALKA